MAAGPTRRTVLVIGAGGFLGGYLAAHLRQRGYHVISGVRKPTSVAGEARHCDFTEMTDPQQWRDALCGVDAVVNAAGILRQTGRQTFETIHVRGPLALAQACADKGVTHFVQVSSLGNPADGEFTASKHRFDAALSELPLRSVVLRPSVVYSTDGSHGGTSLLRALAALPFGLWLPSNGDWWMQPLAVQDLAEIVACAIETEVGGVFEVGGPTPISLRDYQRQWRRWLRIQSERVIHVPAWLVTLQVGVAERLGRGPMNATIWRMLQRGNVVASDATRRLVETFGIAPRALDEVLSVHSSQVQDRWQAGLYFLAPLLRLCLIILWLISAWAGFTSSSQQIAPFAGPLSMTFAVPLARAAGSMDLMFALWLASGWRTRWGLTGMASCVLAYTIVFSFWLPAIWLEPMGGLAKNLAVLPAIAVLWVLSDRR